MTQVWAKFRRLAGKFKPSPPPVLKLNGNSISVPKLVSDIFAEHFVKVSSKDENKPFYRQCTRKKSHFLNFTTQRSESYNMPFDTRELL